MLPALTSHYGPIKQIAYITDDIDTAIDHWHTQMGIGPFAVVRDIAPLTGADYRGERIENVRINVAFSYIGDIQLELIHQINDTPSIYTESLNRGAHSVHHYGVCVDDFDKAYDHASDNGFNTIVKTKMMAYVESEKIPGLILEIVAWNDYTRPYFEGIETFLANADPAQLKHDYQL